MRASLKDIPAGTTTSLEESWLRALLESVNWCYAVVWTADINTGLLSSNKGVYASETFFPQHFARYRACQFSPGEGLAWKAMLERTNMWVSELDSLQSDHMEQMQFFKDAGIKVRPFAVPHDSVMDTEEIDVQTLLCIPTSDGVLELGNMDFVPETPELTEMVEDLLAASNSFSFQQQLLPGCHEEEYGALQTDAQHYAPTEDFGRHFDELQLQQESNIQDCCGLLPAEAIQQQSSYGLATVDVAAQHPNPVNTAWNEYAPAVVYAQGGTNTPQPQLTPQNFNHMLAERRRRKREKEHLDALKLLIPFPTKRDKLSILEGAIKHIQELELRVSDLGGHIQQQHEEAARSDEAESARSGSQKIQVTTGENSSSNRIRLTIHPDVLICTLSCLGRLGFVVDSLQLNADSRSKVDVTAHSTVEGSPSCAEVQEIVKAELLKQSPA